MSGTTRTTVETTTTTVEGTYLEKKDRASLWPLAVGAVGLVGLGLLHGIPVRHSMEDDLEARTRSQVLAASPAFADVKIDFTGRDGVLTGSVPAGTDVEALKKQVADLTGVRDVRLDLTTPGGGGPSASPSPSAAPTTAAPSPSPSDTTSAAPSPSESPSQSASPSPSPAPSGPPAVKAVITKGTLVLTGTVPSEDAAKALVADAENTFGAGNVSNQLTVDTTVGDGGLAGIGAVLSALGKGSDATVDLNGGKLTLTGSVASEDVRKAADAAAATAVGDPSKVVDQLKVNDLQTKLNGLPPIQFQTAYSTLTPEGFRVVQQAADLLKQYPNAKVQIQGHTDDVGTDAVNLELSVARGQQVREALRKMGIADDRMSYAGFGETKPKVPNTSDSNRAINRRVEFVVL